MITRPNIIKSENTTYIPINLPKSKYLEVTNIALKAHKVLKCRGVSRSDFRFYKNKFYIRDQYTTWDDLIISSS